MDEICFIRNEIGAYPKKETLFRPSKRYPEYIFEDISESDNRVYDMIREGFHLLGLDDKNYGTSEWNPLIDYVRPGNRVLIKPNMVLHFNACGGGTDCLYTHPSLVATIVDYVLIALKGEGQIIIGDAPLQECVFDKLVHDSGYDLLQEYYLSKGIDIPIMDFRNVKTIEKGGIHYLQNDKKDDGIVVNLDGDSAFSDVSEERLKNLRITNYDPRILQKHHYGDVHEYKVAEEVLKADVIINMPKPKTHRKAGVTIALKNLVGINANKEYLPHHTIGSKEENGDAYLKSNQYLTMANQVLDIKNILVNNGVFELAKKADELYGALKRCDENELYWEGSWYGNDTIWRTTLDLNRILIFADKNGKMQKERQRKIFIVGDMVISGEKEGPLEPAPINARTVVLGDDPVLFDMAVCSLMGFNYQNIPSISMPGLESKRMDLTDYSVPTIISNYGEWNEKSLEDIQRDYSLGFQPSRGWLDKLGSNKYTTLLNTIKAFNNQIYIFGAGENGLFYTRKFIRDNVNIIGICDNNCKYWGKNLVGKVKGIDPAKIDISVPVVISSNIKYLDEITEQIKKMGGRVLGCV